MLAEIYWIHSVAKPKAGCNATLFSLHSFIYFLRPFQMVSFSLFQVFVWCGNHRVSYAAWLLPHSLNQRTRFEQLNLYTFNNENWFFFSLLVNSNCFHPIIVAIKHAAFLIRFHKFDRRPRSVFIPIGHALDHGRKHATAAAPSLAVVVININSVMKLSTCGRNSFINPISCAHCLESIGNYEVLRI